MLPWLDSIYGVRAGLARRRRLVTRCRTFEGKQITDAHVSQQAQARGLKEGVACSPATSAHHPSFHPTAPALVGSASEGAGQLPGPPHMAAYAKTGVAGRRLAPDPVPSSFPSEHCLRLSATCQANQPPLTQVSQQAKDLDLQKGVSAAPVPPCSPFAPSVTLCFLSRVRNPPLTQISQQPQDLDLQEGVGDASDVVLRGAARLRRRTEAQWGNAGTCV